jgi:hypothetical protein
MAGPDLAFLNIGLANLPFLGRLVGEALVLPGELRPPSLIDLPTFAELYRNGTGKGGGLLSKEVVVDCECCD